MVFSKDLLKQPKLLACLTDAVQDQYRHLIFITYEDEENSVSIKDCESEDIRVAFNIAKKVKWPGETPGRELNNFWIKLRNHLPPPPKPEEPPTPDEIYNINQTADEEGDEGQQTPLLPRGNGYIEAIPIGDVKKGGRDQISTTRVDIEFDPPSTENEPASPDSGTYVKTPIDMCDTDNGTHVKSLLTM